jgi:hypothetical protein
LRLFHSALLWFALFMNLEPTIWGYFLKMKRFYKTFLLKHRVYINGFYSKKTENANLISMPSKIMKLIQHIKNKNGKDINTLRRVIEKNDKLILFRKKIMLFAQIPHIMKDNSKFSYWKHWCFISWITFLKMWRKFRPKDLCIPRQKKYNCL